MSELEPYYEDQYATIYHGDCLDIVPQMDRADLVVTDPPYGVSYVSNTGGRRGKEPIGNDGARLSLRLYRRLMPRLDASHVLWFTRWDAWPDVWEQLGQWFRMRGLLVWDKGTPGMGDLEHWGPSYELIASAGSGKTKPPRQQSVIAFSGVSHAERLHPTEKPVDLLRYLIGKMQDTDVVLDPFAGSGAVLEAAKLEGKRATGIEIEERYCEIAAERLSQGVLALEGAG